jgi:hypothetical protein
MTLHADLLHIRNKGVTNEGICGQVAYENQTKLQILLTAKYGSTNRHDITCCVYPISVTNAINPMHQYQAIHHAVSNGYEAQYHHEYLCERWALLNYLINETEDL